MESFELTTMVPYVALALGMSGIAIVMRRGNTLIKRYNGIDELHPRYYLQKYRMRGVGIQCRDGDNFRFYHIPILQSLTGIASGQLKYKVVSKEELIKMKKQGSIGVRLAGIDAPESAHFGMTAQPLSKEATEYLKDILIIERHGTIKLRKLIIKPLKRDQYNRLVSMVYYQVVPFIPWYKNISEEMVKKGLAVVYTASGAEYGGLKDKLLKLESIATRKKIGIWGLKNFVRPGDYKEEFKKSKS